MPEIYLDTILANSYFDGNDYENPIKDYMDDRIYAFPNWGYCSGMFAYMQKNSIELKDSVYRYSPDDNEKEFSYAQNNEPENKKHYIPKALDEREEIKENIEDCMKRGSKNTSEINFINANENCKQIYKDNDPNSDIAEKATENIKQRYKYNYSIYDFMYNLMFPFKCIGRK